MRITQGSTLGTYQTNLDSIRARLTKEQLRVTTGKNFQTPSDSPHDFSEIKRLTNTIEQNERYKTNLLDGRTDVHIYEDTLGNFADTLQRLRDIANDAANPINADKLPVLGNNIRKLLDDLVKVGNYEFDGRFAFAGTLTTRNSITPTAPATDNLPFEIVQDAGAVSNANPEGLRVVFKGNNEDRFITTSSTSTERISVRAQDAFGTGSTQVFQEVIDVYNLLNYKSDGTARTIADKLTNDEAHTLQQKITEVSNSIDRVNSEAGRLGGVSNRMSALEEQLVYENTRLRDLRSGREDADIPRTLLNLRQEETTLEASLRVGGSIVQRTLLDFLR